MSFQPPPFPRPGAGFGAAPGSGFGGGAGPTGFGPPPSYGGNQASYSSGGPYGAGPGPRAGRADEDKLGKVKDPLLQAVKWLQTRNSKEKTVLGCAAGVLVRGQAAGTGQPPRDSVCAQQPAPVGAGARLRHRQGTHSDPVHPPGPAPPPSCSSSCGAPWKITTRCSCWLRRPTLWA